MRTKTVVTILISLLLITVFFLFLQEDKEKELLNNQHYLHILQIKSSSLSVAAFSEDLLINWDDYKNEDIIRRLNHIYGLLYSIEQSTFYINPKVHFKDFNSGDSLRLITNFYFAYQDAVQELILMFYQNDNLQHIKEELHLLKSDMEIISKYFDDYDVEKRSFTEISAFWGELADQMSYEKAMKHYQSTMSRP